MAIESNQIIAEHFGDKEIEFIKKEEKVWIYSRAIAKGLEIDRTNIHQIYHRNKKILTPYTGVIEIITPGGKQKTRVFDKTGFIWICVRSNSPKALRFQEWVLNVIDRVIKKGYYIEKPSEMNSIDALIKLSENFTKQSKMITKVFMTLRESQKKIAFLETKVDSVDLNIREQRRELRDFEQKYEDEKTITPSTLRKIQDFVYKVRVHTDLHWNTIWSKIFQVFEISRIKDIPEKQGREIVKWLYNNPKFYEEGI